MKKTGMKMTAAVAVVLAIAGCAAMASDADYNKIVQDMLTNDFKDKGPATVARVTNQDEAQRLCSEYPMAEERPKEISARIEAGEMKNIKLPADGKYLGNWQQGEKVAQSGHGMRWNDKSTTINGGNCYACHQMTKEEISFGNIGPSLYHYGKLRGQSDEIVKYTWGKIYNAQAYSACSNMPRFGHNGVLTEAQMKDVMALLLDPASPVNR
jgi:sulfur-oxidizing protein SoxX